MFSTANNDIVTTFFTFNVIWVFLFQMKHGGQLEISVICDGLNFMIMGIRPL